MLIEWTKTCNSDGFSICIDWPPHKLHWWHSLNDVEWKFQKLWINTKQDIGKAIDIIEKASKYNHPQVNVLLFFINLCEDFKAIDINKVFFYLKKICKSSDISDNKKIFYKKLFYSTNQDIHLYINRFKYFDMIYTRNEPDFYDYIVNGSIEKSNEIAKKYIQDINHFFYEGFGLIILLF